MTAFSSLSPAWIFWAFMYLNIRSRSIKRCQQRAPCSSAGLRNAAKHGEHAQNPTNSMSRRDLIGPAVQGRLFPFHQPRQPVLGLRASHQVPALFPFLLSCLGFFSLHRRLQFSSIHFHKSLYQIHASKCDPAVPQPVASLDLGPGITSVAHNINKCKETNAGR